MRDLRSPSRKLYWRCSVEHKYSWMLVLIEETGVGSRRGITLHKAHHREGLLSPDAPMTNYQVKRAGRSLPYLGAAVEGIANVFKVPDFIPAATTQNGITRSVGEAVTLLVNLVDDIPLEPNGKFLHYECYLDQSEVA